MSKELLNIVDDTDNIIGTENRKIIHEQGLLHREVHVWLVSSNREIIFQHRAKDKDLFPDLLDATVGGHVEIGESYEEAAIKETFEETGVVIKAGDLMPVIKARNKFEDVVTGKTNHAFQQEFVYVYRGHVEDLKIEAGKGLGFAAWSIESLMELGDAEKAKFIPCIYQFAITTLRKFIDNNL